MTLTLAELTKTVFEPLLHARFSVSVGGEPPLELELIELNEPATRGCAPGSGRQPFSLIFRGPRDPWFQQGTYAIEHPELGAQQIFLVPVGPDAHGMQYQAVFN